jgi:hypothetical protein
MKKLLQAHIIMVIALLIMPTAIAMNNLAQEYTINEKELLSIPLKVDSQTPYSFAAFALPQNAQLTDYSNNTARLQFLPQTGQSGEYMIIIRAIPASSESPTIEKSVLLKVIKTNSAPQIVQHSPQQQQVNMQQGTKQTFIIIAVDPDGDALSYEWRVNGQLSGLTSVFEYSAPHSVTGTQTIEARVTDGTLTATKSWTANVEQVDLLPILMDILSPPANVQSRTAILSLTTSKDTECRAGERVKPFASLTPLRITGTQYHEGEIIGLTEGLMRLRVECRSGSQITGKDIDIMVELPAEAVIKLNRNVPLKDGEVQVLISTDKHLKETPQLQYYYDSNPGRKMTVALEPYENYDRSWIGTLIVPNSNEKTQIVFEYTGVTLKGARSSTIIEGRSFPVDTKPPERIETLQISAESSRIILRWMSDDDDIAYYSVYRSTKSDITPLDIYRNVNTSILEDTNLSAREYFYSIAAVDRAGNRGPLSRVVSAQATGVQDTKSQEPLLTTQDRVRINSTVNEIDRNLLDINAAISDLQREKSTARSTKEFDVAISENTELKIELERYRMQLTQLSPTTRPEELNSLLTTLNNRITQIRSEATMKVRIIETSEHLQDIDEQSSRGLLQDYLAGKRAGEQQIKEAQRNIMGTQSFFRVESTLTVVERTRVTGQVSYVSIIERRYSYETPDSMQSSIIIERMPQELQEKAYTIEPRETTKTRSIVQHSIGTLGYTPYTITYRFNEQVSQSSFKKFYAIAYPEDGRTSIGPTGTSIFGSGTMRSMSITFLVILLALVAVAGAVYKFGPQLSDIKTKLMPAAFSTEDSNYLKRIQQLEESISQHNQDAGTSIQQIQQPQQSATSTSTPVPPAEDRQPVIEIKYLVRWQNKEPLTVKGNSLSSVPHIVRELRSMSSNEYNIYRRQFALWSERNGYSELKDAFMEEDVKSCLKNLKSRIIK